MRYKLIINMEYQCQSIELKLFEFMGEYKKDSYRNRFWNYKLGLERSFISVPPTQINEGKSEGIQITVDEKLGGIHNKTAAACCCCMKFFFYVYDMIWSL